MKVRLVRKEKLDEANENIAQLINAVIDGEIRTNEGYCLHRVQPNEREAICKRFNSCRECEMDFYENRRRELIEKYTVKG